MNTDIKEEAEEQTENDSNNQKEEFKIQITTSFSNGSKQFKKHQHIVQGEPFAWGVKIKNIDLKPTPNALITSGYINDLSEKFYSNMDKEEIFVRSLNPNEELYFELGSTIIYLEGMMWNTIEIEPKDDDSCFITYQYDEQHNKLEKFSIEDEDKDKWMDTIYVQKRIELLQSRTNSYILLLTIIIVWETVFGIKDTLKIVASWISNIFYYIHLGVQWIGGLL